MDVPRFRLATSKVILTFAQVRHYEHIDELMGYHLAYLPPTKYYLIGHELHQDGGHHYHLVIEFQERLNIHRADYFDWMFDAHPNIKPIKAGRINMDRAIKYVQKENDFLEDGVNPCGADQPRPTELVIAAIKAGKTDFEICQDHGKWAIVHLNHIQQFRSIWLGGPPVALEPYRIPVYERGLQFGDLHDESVQRICDWIERNILVPRDYRQEHLWIVGPPLVGKSRLSGQLSKMVRTYYPPMDGWFCNFSNLCDLVVFNEFEGQYTPSQMKTFCEQSIPSVMLNTKGGHAIKTRNQPCIVLSNKTIEECYHHVAAMNPASLDALKARFIVVRVLREFNVYPE